MAQHFSPPLAMVETDRIAAFARVMTGATLGRGCVIGPHCLVEPDYARVDGNPTRPVGWVCACGRALDLPLQGSAAATCPCGLAYALTGGQVNEVT